MIDVLRTVVVKASPAAAAQVMFDPARDVEWIGGAQRAKLVSPGPLHVGSRVRREGAFLGRPIAWVTEVMEIAPDERLVMRVMEGPFVGGEVTYLVGPFRDGARVSIRNRGRSPAPLPFVGMIVGASVLKDLQRLKAIIEREAG
jgi:Polyketide cyclase / dehydrase and lipid transport